MLHLAYIHDFARDYEEILSIDAAAVDALAEPLRGTGKAFVITSGTAVVEPDAQGGETTEDSPLSETFILRHRIRSERHALRLSEEGVRVSAIRLPPYVFGRGGRNDRRAATPFRALRQPRRGGSEMGSVPDGLRSIRKPGVQS